MKIINRLNVLLLIIVICFIAGVAQGKSQKRYVKPLEEEVEQVEEEREVVDEKPVKADAVPGQEGSELDEAGESKIEDNSEKVEGKEQEKGKETAEPVIEKKLPVKDYAIEKEKDEKVLVEPSSPVLSNPVSVILMVANGMGTSLYGIANYYCQFGKNRVLNMNEVMNNGATGYLTNYSSNYIVSDNAAAASALATGLKVNNGVISITPEGEKPETILEKMKKKGMGIGMVTTCEVTDALTAAFSAHAESEDMKESIASQQLELGLDVIMGGGFKWFDVKKRSDGKDLMQRFQRRKYNIVTTRNELSKVGVNNTDKLIGLFADRMLDFSVNNNKEQPTLSHMVRVALGILERREQGFFLLVEGGRIAHAAHGNLANEVIGEVSSFDEAVGEVLEFMRYNPDVLLIITSNIEVGCPIISKKDWDEKYMQKQDIKQIIKKGKKFISWPTQHHTATPVFVFAMGPGSEKVIGMHDNTEMIEVMETEKVVVLTDSEATEVTEFVEEKTKKAKPPKKEEKPRRRRRRR